MTTILISAESSAGSCPSCTARRTVRTAPAASRSNKWADLNWVQISDQNISLVTHTLCWPFKSKGTLRKQTLFSDLFVEWSLELDQNCLWKPTHNHSVSSCWNQDFFFSLGTWICYVFTAKLSCIIVSVKYFAFELMLQIFLHKCFLDLVPETFGSHAASQNPSLLKTRK